MEEVQSRGGELFVFADENSGIHGKDRQHVVHIPSVNEWLAPIVYSIPVQLLSYHKLRYYVEQMSISHVTRQKA